MMRLLRFALADATRHPRHLALAAVGIVVGMSLFAFFSALGAGVQRGVVNRMHPVDRIEVHPAPKADASPSAALDDETLERLAHVDGIRGVHPRQKARFQGRVFGGRGILGRDVHTEALFDGMEPDLLRREMQGVEAAIGDALSGGGHATACAQDEECGLARACVESRCRDVRWADGFRDHGEVIPCASGEKCLSGACEGGVCAGTRPRTDCGELWDCPRGQVCGANGRCEAMRCRVAVDEASGSLWDRGVLVDWCADGPRSGAAPCRALRECPSGTYCAAVHRGSPEGHCERPIPAAVNPMLVEMFNSAGAAALGMPALAGPEALIGLRFQIRHGDSFFGTREDVGLQVERWVEVVGFSDKALALGVTFPLAYVARANARYRGRSAGALPDSVVLQATSNEAVVGVARAAERMGLALTPRSADARDASRMLWVVTLIFQLISALVLGMGLVNVAHVFRLLVHERRKELGVLRAVGATRGDVRGLVLIQSSALGVLAGLLGFALAWAVGWCVDEFLLAGGLLAPSGSVFHWSPVWMWAVPAVALGCLSGAWGPATQAADLELAEVLSPS